MSLLFIFWKKNLLSFINLFCFVLFFLSLFHFLYALIFVISFLQRTLDLVFSFYISLRYKIRLFIWHHFLFDESIYSYELPFLLAFAASYKFWYVAFPFLLVLIFFHFSFNFLFDPLIVQEYKVFSIIQVIVIPDSG